MLHVHLNMVVDCENFPEFSLAYEADPRLAWLLAAAH